MAGEGAKRSGAALFDTPSVFCGTGGSFSCSFKTFFIDALLRLDLVFFVARDGSGTTAAGSGLGGSTTSSSSDGRWSTVSASKPVIDAKRLVARISGRPFFGPVAPRAGMGSRELVVMEPKRLRCLPCIT